jgi:hypothetical protein
MAHDFLTFPPPIFQLASRGPLFEEGKELRQNLIHDEIRHPLDEPRFAGL